LRSRRRQDASGRVYLSVTGPEPDRFPGCSSRGPEVHGCQCMPPMSRSTPPVPLAGAPPSQVVAGSRGRCKHARPARVVAPRSAARTVAHPARTRCMAWTHVPSVMLQSVTVTHCDRQFWARGDTSDGLSHSRPATSQESDNFCPTFLRMVLVAERCTSP
jgi:hypothetical protein